MDKTKAIIIVILCTFLTSLGQLLIKYGANKLSFQNLLTIFSFELISGILVYGLAAVLFIGVLRRVDLSMVYPIIGTSFIWVAILSYIFLRESMNILKISGIFIIVLGVALIGRSS
ncbi:MAG: EamA family transporter [Nanoarchaeota archaeon]